MHNCAHKCLIYFLGTACSLCKIIRGINFETLSELQLLHLPYFKKAEVFQTWSSSAIIMHKHIIGYHFQFILYLLYSTQLHMFRVFNVVLN